MQLGDPNGGQRIAAMGGRRWLHSPCTAETDYDVHTVRYHHVHHRLRQLGTVRAKNASRSYQRWSR